MPEDSRLGEIRRKIEEALRDLDDYNRREQQRAVENLPPEERRRLWRVITGGLGVGVVTWLWQRIREQPVVVATSAVGAVVASLVTAPPALDGGGAFAEPPRDIRVLDPEAAASPTTSFDRSPPPPLTPSEMIPEAPLPLTGRPETPSQSPTPTWSSPPPPTDTPTPTRPPKTPPSSPTPPPPTPTPTPTPNWLACIDVAPALKDACVVNLDDLLGQAFAPSSSALDLLDVQRPGDLA